jgi:hypothetical protein
MPDLKVTIDTGESRRLAELQAQTPAIVQKVLRDALKTLMARVQRDTPVGIKPRKMPSGVKRKKGISQVSWVQTGDLKKSWLGELRGDSIEVKANVTKWKYPWVLEEGKYPGIGKLKYGKGPGGIIQVSPRTVRSGGGIFSSRATQGILSPIVKDESFLTSITQSIINQMREVLV